MSLIFTGRDHLGVCQYISCSQKFLSHSLSRPRIFKDANQQQIILFSSGKGSERYLIITNVLSPLCQYQSAVLISKMASNSMENIPKMITGGCLCGGVRYEINFSPEHDWKRGVYSLPCNPFLLRDSSTDYHCSLTHANALSAVRIVAAWYTTSIQ
jgi:hypothetical protein